jgi:murein DD-endopeptidase MepM/ murein hydrolase activator NlpD
MAGAQQQPGSVTVKVAPEHPYIEKGEFGQYLNFDLLVDNPTEATLHLFRLEASAFDDKGALLFRRFLVDDGDSPGIYTIPKIDLKAKEALYVFNPFYAIDPSVHIRQMRYEFTFDVAGSQERRSASVIVAPEDYETKTKLIIPIHGRLIVYDGHDFYSHHRRVNLNQPIVQKMGFHDNPVRYAYDLCPVNEHNALYHGDPTKKENWYAYGTPVYAPGDGVVVSAENTLKENTIEGKKLVMPPDFPDTIIAGEGNHVIIDHGNGEYSELAHMQTGSVEVKKGDRVKRGQLLGKLGFSGDTGHHVHLHYQLMSSTEIPEIRSLPSYFSDFRRIKGSLVVQVERGSIDTGEIIESGASPPQ